MVHSQCPKCLFSWLCREHSMPEHTVHCWSQLLVSICKFSRWLWGSQGGESCDLSPPLHHLPLTVQCQLLTAAAVPGKSKLCPFIEVVKELGVYHMSFCIKELIAITPAVSMKLWSKNQGHSQCGETLCDFALVPLLVLQQYFPIISSPSSAFFSFSQSRRAYWLGCDQARAFYNRKM